MFRLDAVLKAVWRLVLVIPFSAHAFFDEPASNDYNEELETPWVELEAQVKALPREEDLVEVDLGKLPPNMKLHLDLPHLEVGEDTVTRTWMVARSSSGAYNASYEGLRCGTREYKVYAYYNPKRSKPLRIIELPDWKPVRAGSYRAELMKYVLCNGQAAESVERIADNIAQDFSSFRLPY